MGSFGRPQSHHFLTTLFQTPDIEVKKPTVEKKPTPSLPSSNTSEDSQNPNQGEKE